MIVAVLGAWLLLWITTTWPAMQDDALIHLRYADNLYRHHLVSYDGVHPNYGASSLLYVTLLALLRGLTTSPELPRAVSSVVHLLLFGGLAWMFARLPRRSGVARLAGLVLLVLLVTPSAVRWLDDGMETGLAVSAAVGMAWVIRVHLDAGSRVRTVALGLFAFLAVMLRTELLLLCGEAVVLVLVQRGWRRRSFRGAAVVALGAGLAIVLIAGTMHVLLPDTALAKAHGIAHWFNPIHDTAVTLAGAFSFGAGMVAFWLLTLLLVAMRRGISATMVLANCAGPVVVALSALRGQEIQGVRYLAWTLFFSTIWNILELAEEAERAPSALETSWTDRHGAAVLYVFLGLLALELPLESVAMRRVMLHRGATVRQFEAQHLEVLRERRGVASDIGLIGYFSGAGICDLAGLVNGRAAARLTSAQRVATCAATDPDFLFVSTSQMRSMKSAMDLTGWQVCGRYNFANVRTEDIHLLLTRPEIAEQVCTATGNVPMTLQDRIR